MNKHYRSIRCIFFFSLLSVAYITELGASEFDNGLIAAWNQENPRSNQFSDQQKINYFTNMNFGTKFNGNRIKARVEDLLSSAGENEQEKSKEQQERDMQQATYIVLDMYKFDKWSFITFPSHIVHKLMKWTGLKTWWNGFEEVTGMPLLMKVRDQYATNIGNKLQHIGGQYHADLGYEPGKKFDQDLQRTNHVQYLIDQDNSNLIKLLESNTKNIAMLNQECLRRIQRMESAVVNIVSKVVLVSLENKCKNKVERLNQELVNLKSLFEHSQNREEKSQLSDQIEKKKRKCEEYVRILRSVQTPDLLTTLLKNTYNETKGDFCGVTYLKDMINAINERITKSSSPRSIYSVQAEYKNLLQTFQQPPLQQPPLQDEGLEGRYGNAVLYDDGEGEGNEEEDEGEGLLPRNRNRQEQGLAGNQNQVQAQVVQPNNNNGAALGGGQQEPFNRDRIVLYLNQRKNDYRASWSNFYDSLVTKDGRLSTQQRKNIRAQAEALINQGLGQIARLDSEIMTYLDGVSNQSAQTIIDQVNLMLHTQDQLICDMTKRESQELTQFKHRIMMEERV